METCKGFFEDVMDVFKTSINKLISWKKSEMSETSKNTSSWTGFEPVREYPIWFRVKRLNHSATTTTAQCDEQELYSYVSFCSSYTLCHLLIFSGCAFRLLFISRNIQRSLHPMSIKISICGCLVIATFVFLPQRIA